MWDTWIKDSSRKTTGHLKVSSLLGRYAVPLLKCLLICTASYPKRLYPLSIPLWEPQNPSRRAYFYCFVSSLIILNTLVLVSCRALNWKRNPKTQVPFNEEVLNVVVIEISFFVLPFYLCILRHILLEPIWPTCCMYLIQNLAHIRGGGIEN
jgi:hypothetical protein